LPVRPPPHRRRSNTVRIVDALFDVSSKTVLVTGGSRGIGRMIATGFAERGAKVYISSRKEAELRQTADEIGATALTADLSTEAGALALAAAFAERESQLHVLVNNAGATWGASLMDYPDSAFDKVFSTNIKGPFHLTRALVPQLEAAATAGDPARVIMIGSIEGIMVPEWENYAYPASKAGIHMLTRQLASKLCPTITVNAIAPGLFASKMTAFVFDDDPAAAEVSKRIPMRRAGEGSDMAGVAVFLASRAGAYLTGAVIPVDGGLSTHG
jgi:NAD(P)-dependent dehydrogenase (short-subunit alcohol dehydrogenase family)